MSYDKPVCKLCGQPAVVDESNAAVTGYCLKHLCVDAHVCAALYEELRRAALDYREPSQSVQRT
jgi:hypothetical protein